MEKYSFGSQVTDHQAVILKNPDILNPIKCLNHGFVRLVDWFGDDKSIVDAARVSYNKHEIVKTEEEDKKLINYLLKNLHTTPFEMISFKFHCRMPIFVARQWIRHRTAKVNELSGRYSVMKDDFYEPDFEQIKHQSKSNKQGRDDEAFFKDEYKARFVDELKKDQSTVYAHYESYINDDMAKELARINLPLSLYTEWYWKMDLHNLFHFLKLRLDSHAQYEIRIFGQAMAHLVKKVVPLAYEAFEEHILYAKKFSRSEWQRILEMNPNLKGL
jgi:thymidylate synthase (FAD)